MYELQQIADIYTRATGESSLLNGGSKGARVPEVYLHSHFHAIFGPTGQSITSNCREILHPDQPINLIVSSICGDVSEQNSIGNKCLCR